MSYKIFCFEAPLQLGAQEFWFFQKVDECVVLVHFVEAFPVLFQGPHIQLIVGIRKCISQGHGFCKFSICGNDFHRIPEVTSLSKPSAAKIMFTSSGSLLLSKSLLMTGIKAGSKCLASPPLTSRFAHLLQGFWASVNIDIFRFVSLVVASWNEYSTWICSNSPRPLLAYFSWAFSPAAIVKNSTNHVTIKSLAKKDVQRVPLDILAGDVAQLKQGAVTCRLCHVLSMAVFLKFCFSKRISFTAFSNAQPSQFSPSHSWHGSWAFQWGRPIGHLRRTPGPPLWTTMCL